MEKEKKWDTLNLIEMYNMRQKKQSLALALPNKPESRFYYGWIIVAVCFLCWLVVDAFGFYTFGLYIVPINKELGWSSMTITGAMTVRMITAAFIGPFVGYITDKKYGARVLMTIGIFVAGTTTFFISYVQKPWEFYLLYGIIGALGMIGFGGLVTHTTIAKWFIRMRGRAMGIATLGVSVSGMLFIPITHYMIEHHGWRNSLRVMGIIILCTALIPAIVFIRRRPEDIGLKPDGDDSHNMPESDKNSFQTTDIKSLSYSWTPKEALRTKTLWILLAAFNVTGLSLTGIMVHFYPYMKAKGIKMDVAAASMTLFAVCCAIVKIPWGLMAEKFPVRYCVIVVFSGSAFGMFVLLNAQTPFFIFVYAIIYGIALGGMIVLREVLFADYYRHEFLGTIRGIVMPINVLFMSASPILAAWLYETFGNYQVPYTVFLCTFLLGAFLMFFAKPPVPVAESSA